MKGVNAGFESIITFSSSVYKDERGSLIETFNDVLIRSIGNKFKFVHEIVTTSKKDVLRGLHYTVLRPQAQLVTVLDGAVFDVVVDMRSGSASLGSWKSYNLCDSELNQIFIPPGFAHGFCVLSNQATLHYKISESYNVDDDFGIRWDDKDLGISWPTPKPVLSMRDQSHGVFRSAPQVNTF